MLTFDQIISRLHEINKNGYVKTHRSGDTGIGKTLEDLLGIKENNIPSTNAHLIELKSGRKNAASMITLFTKSPLPDGANTVLLKSHGYPSRRGNNKKELHTTIWSTSLNTLKGKPGFRINVKDDRLELIDGNNQVVGYWTKDILKSSFNKKLPHVMYVKANSRGKGVNEEFWYNEAWLLNSFDFENFINLIKEDEVVVDIRIGQYPDGRTHDHGTGFRVLPSKLELCFKNRERLI